MILSIEMEAEDWLDLLALHKDVMEVITSNMANDPIAYSSAARLTNQIFDQVLKKLPSGEIDNILARRRQEKEG
jgi:hypothetical protein